MRPAALLAPLALVLLAPASGRADMIMEGFTRVPLELNLDHVEAFPDKEIVLFGCSQPGGRTSIVFAKKDAPLTCRLKFGIEVLLVTPKTAKDLRDLVAKDLGYGQEGLAAQKIIDAAKPLKCGTIQETTEVEEKLGIKKIVARYALEAKADKTCAISKTSSEKIVAPAPSADSSAVPAPSASAAPSAEPSAAPSAEPPAPAAKSGCGNGCAAAPSASSWPLAGALLVLGLVALRRPRQRP